MAAKDFAASLLSPCIGEERTVVLYPNFVAFSLASSTAILLEPIITFCVLTNTLFPRLGFSSISPVLPFSKSLFTLSGILFFSEYFWITLQASSNVLSSGTVGPEAIMSIGSPITSDSISVTSVEGYEAFASCPPFMVDKCFLTELISPISAPQLSSSFEATCTSCKDISLCG